MDILGLTLNIDGSGNCWFNSRLRTWYDLVMEELALLGYNPDLGRI